METIAAQWKRAGLKTASEAMDFAEKENKKLQKKEYVKTNKVVETPIWFNQKIKDETLKSKKKNLKKL